MDAIPFETNFFLTLLLFAFSTNAAQMGTWTSNPVLAMITIPRFSFIFYTEFFG